LKIKKKLTKTTINIPYKIRWQRLNQKCHRTWGDE
jgi:hypothetical protein